MVATALVLVLAFQQQSQPDTDLAKLLETDRVDIPLLRQALAAGANPNLILKSGHTPLSLAGYYQDGRLIKLLLEFKADPNLRDREGVGPIHTVVSWNEIDAGDGHEQERCISRLRMLIDAGARIDEPCAKGMTALMYASGWHHPRVQKALLDLGADPKKRDDRGRTALTWAARDGRKSDVVKNLLAAGCRIELTDALLLEDWPLALKLVKDSKAEIPGPYTESDLAIAAEFGQVELAEIFLKKGADVNAFDDRGVSALMRAVAGRRVVTQAGSAYYEDSAREEDRFAIVEMLLGAGADINGRAARNDPTALDRAMEAKHKQIVDLLRRNGGNTRGELDK